MNMKVHHSQARCAPTLTDSKCRRCALWVDQANQPYGINLAVYPAQGSHTDECRFVEVDRKPLDASTFEGMQHV